MNVTKKSEFKDAINSYLAPLLLALVTFFLINLYNDISSLKIDMINQRIEAQRIKSEVEIFRSEISTSKSQQDEIFKFLIKNKNE